MEQYIDSEKEIKYIDDLRHIENNIYSINSICKRIGFIYSRNFELMLHTLLHYYFVEDMIKYYETSPMEWIINYPFTLLYAKIINHLNVLYDENDEKDSNKISKWLAEIQLDKYKKIPK